MIDRALQQLFAEPHIVRIDVVLVWERHFRRLFVGALAQPHPDPIGDQLLNVRLRAIQVGLDHHADGVRADRLAHAAAARCPASPRSAASPPYRCAQSCPVALACWARLVGNRLRQRGIESKPHLRQLHADVGVQLALGNRIQQPVIHIGCLVRLLCGGNALPSESSVTCMPCR